MEHLKKSSFIESISYGLTVGLSLYFSFSAAAIVSSFLMQVLASMLRTLMFFSACALISDTCFVIALTAVSFAVETAVRDLATGFLMLL